MMGYKDDIKYSPIFQYNPVIKINFKDASYSYKELNLAYLRKILDEIM